MPVGSGKKPGQDEFALGREINHKLRHKKLPKMVDWYDPALLAGIGVREVISGTMGQYADQRQMQAATDRVDNECDLVHRYDYSMQPCQHPPVGKIECDGKYPVKPRSIDWDPANPGSIPDTYWVDYIADLGDGFEATYAMAYLMAPDELLVAGCKGAEEIQETSAGRILIMGGDQAYPQATAKEYQNRLLNPYNWAHSPRVPTNRKLFAIPGNHDWYDGLTAFDGVFCAARDRMSQGEGKKIGGWRSEQHRSYFAIKMPHNWWIWGADIQLEGHLDDAQKDYFDLVSEHMGRDDKVIICLAEPSWLHAEYQNLREIVMMASKRDSRICAVLAGDWHHYSRYYAKDLGISFITCGGGGAFAHATHSLKSSLKLSWPVKTGKVGPQMEAGESYEHQMAEERVGGHTDYKETKVGASALEDGNTHAHSRRKRREQELDPLVMEPDDRHDCIAPHIYPSRIKSRLLSLWNLLLPFYHWKFAAGLGFIYFLYSWVAFGVFCDYSHSFPNIVESDRFSVYACNLPDTSNAAMLTTLAENQSAGAAAPGAGPAPPAAGAAAQPPAGTPAPAATPAKPKLEQPVATGWLASIKGWVEFLWAFTQVAMAKSIAFTILVTGLLFGLIMYVDVSGFKNVLLDNWIAKGLTKVVVGTAHFLGHAIAIAALTLTINTIIFAVAMVQSGTTAEQSERPGIIGMALVTGMTLYDPKGMFAAIEAAEKDNPKEGAAIRKRFSNNFEKLRVRMGPLFLIPFGGLIGGLVFGLYWTITCAFFSMHTGDAFGALALRNYKHFLRMKFEPDKVTIYAIKLDKVPGRKGWRPRSQQDADLAHKPQLMPKFPLQPTLIEPPIEINAADVWQRPGLVAKAAATPTSTEAVEEPALVQEPVVNPGIPG